MALPLPFTSANHYFQTCVDFLKRFSWIYQFSNTRFIKDGVLDKFPPDWIDYFNNVSTEELNRFPIMDLSSVNLITSSSIKKFLHQVVELTLTPVQSITNEFGSMPDSMTRFKKISLKKQHEISRLSRLINKICSYDVILIDFGSGLGYLTEALLGLDGRYRIVGLEADIYRVKTAKHRLEANSRIPSDRVRYQQHFITESSENAILENIKQFKEDRQRLAIIGLHACADLTVTSMKLFFALKSIEKLIIMPCCYHKMQLDTYCFKNFPLSRALKAEFIKDDKVALLLNRPFLRLACQQTSTRWKMCTEFEHEIHGKDMFLRGIAEAILADHEAAVKVKGKNASPYKNLTFTELCERYELHSKETHNVELWTERHELHFNGLLQKYPHGTKLAEGLTCLQTTIQKLCENIVLYDRLCYMNETAKERNLKISVKFEKLMDETLSPRCYALIAEKL